MTQITVSQPRIVLTRQSCLGTPLEEKQRFALEEEFEADMAAYEITVARTIETLEAIDRATGATRILQDFSFFLSGLAVVWLLGRLVTGI